MDLSKFGPLTARERYVGDGGYRQTMRHLKTIFLLQGHHAGLLDHTENRDGAALPLSPPPGFFLEIARLDRIVASMRASGRIGPAPWSENLCCVRPMTPLGFLRAVDPGTNDRLGTMSILLGIDGAVWCYDPDENVTYMVSRDLDELARRGLLHLEPLYNRGILPRATVEPVMAVEALLRASSAEPRSRAAKSVARTAYRFRGQVIFLHTPGEGVHPLSLCGATSMLWAHWPFRALRDRTFSDMLLHWTRRMSCAWWVLGVVGDFQRTGILHTRVVILLDASAAVYGFDLVDRRIVRIAEDLTTFFCAGLSKLMLPGRRREAPRRAAARLEAHPNCSGCGQLTWQHYARDMGLLPWNLDFSGLWSWLTRPGRFRPCADPAKIPWYERGGDYFSPCDTEDAPAFSRVPMKDRFDFPERYRSAEELSTEARRLRWGPVDGALRRVLEDERRRLTERPWDVAWDQRELHRWRAPGTPADEDGTETVLRRVAHAMLEEEGIFIQPVWLPRNCEGHPLEMEYGQMRRITVGFFDCEVVGMSDEEGEPTDDGTAPHDVPGPRPPFQNSGEEDCFAQARLEREMVYEARVRETRDARPGRRPIAAPRQSATSVPVSATAGTNTSGGDADKRP